MPNSTKKISSFFISIMSKLSSLITMSNYEIVINGDLTEVAFDGWNLYITFV